MSRSIEEIQDRIAAKNEERRKLGLRPRKPDRSISPEQRKQLRDINFDRQRKIAERADHIHPIRRERLDVNATQRELADAALVRTSSLARIERGEFQPSNMMLQRLRHGLKIISRRG